MNPATVRILLSGYYGYGNLGDDALLAVIVEQLRKRFPLAVIDVLSATPEDTAHRLRVEATPRGDIPAVKRAVDRADVVLSGGGGLLQNATSLKSLLYYAGILKMATMAKKKAMIFAQSIGPLDMIGRKSVSELCSGLALATVRDRRSHALLTRLLPKTRVEITGDPVFLFEPGEAADPAVTLGIKDDGSPLALVSVRKSLQSDLVATRVAAAVDRLFDRHGIRSVFFPLGGAADADVSTTVIRKCASQPLLLPAADLPTAARLIARCSVVIGMRLHALILAARLGVPFVALAYDPKVSALVEDLAYPLAPLWSSETQTTPLPNGDALIDALVERQTELAASLRESALRMRAAAALNFELLEAYIR